MVNNESFLIKEPELAGLFPSESHEPKKDETRVSFQENGKTILVVEDDATNRSALCRILRREGWDVAEAVDGSTAMNMLKTENPGLILLDLVLPDVNGFDFLEKFGQNGHDGGVPVIVLTAKELSSAEKKLLEKKVHCVFQKGNYSRTELIEKIYGLIEPSPHLR